MSVEMPNATTGELQWRLPLPSQEKPTDPAVADIDGVGCIGAVPLAPTGKVDRDALPEPDWPGRRTATKAGTGPNGAPGVTGATDSVERDLLAMWAGLLGRPGLRRDDDFFDRGGRWSTILRLLHQVRHRFGVGLGARQVYQAPTVAEFSRVVAGAVRAATGSHDLPDATAGRPRKGDGDDG